MDAIQFKMLSLAAFLAVALVLFGYLIRKTKEKDNPIELDDLLLEVGPDGTRRVSKTACVMWAAFLASTWVLLYEVVAGRPIETLYAAYLAVWVTPILATIIKGRPPHALQPPNESPAA